MRYLLDTNVVSEWATTRPSPNVLRWLEQVPEGDVFLSTITVAELQRGLLLLDPGGRRDRLASWLRSELLVRFDRRVLPVSLSTALVWGRLMAESRQAGANVDAMDAFIAATAVEHGLTVATRNIRHFMTLDIPLLDPWSI